MGWRSKRKSRFVRKFMALTKYIEDPCFETWRGYTKLPACPCAGPIVRDYAGGNWLIPFLVVKGGVVSYCCDNCPMHVPDATTFGLTDTCLAHLYLEDTYTEKQGEVLLRAIRFREMIFFAVSGGAGDG